MGYKRKDNYSNDFLRWSNIWVNNSLKIHKKKESDPKLDSIQENIIKDNDAALAFHFACDIGYKNHLMQNVIIKSKSPKYATLFAQNIPNADISTLQNIVMQTNNMELICRFVKLVKGANKKKFEDMVLETKNAKGAHMLIKYCDTNPKRFKKILLESKKPRYIYELSKHITNKKELKIIESLLIESKSLIYIRLFAKKIKSANIGELEKVVLDSGNVNEIKRFARQVKKSKIANFQIMF